MIRRKTNSRILVALCILAALSTACFTKQVRTSAASEKLLGYLEEAKADIPQDTPPAGSLWNERSAYLVSDFKARLRGDIVTVIVRENTDAVSTAAAETARTSQQSTSIPLLGGAERRFKELQNLSSGQGSSTFSGKGTTTRQSTLSATVTARVRDVLPNGNLVIEGYRDVRIHSENQSLTLSGVIRPRDITPDNEVASSAIGYLEVKLQGKGLVTDNLKPGWLFRLLRGISPF